MAKRRRTRISYAPKSRRKSSASNRTLTTSSIHEQEKEQETVKLKSKQKNRRILYKPKVRRKTSAASSTASENVSSNEQEAKELPRRNKRRSIGTLMAANKQQPKKKKENWSSSEENTVQKASTSGQGKEKQKTTPKKGVTQRKKRVEETNKMPKHIKDITVGRKTYAKWRLLNPVTKAFTEQALESAMLNVLNSVGREFKKKEVQAHLKKLSESCVSHCNVSHFITRELENAVISCNEQIEVLEKELEEQTSPLPKTCDKESKAFIPLKDKMQFASPWKIILKLQTLARLSHIKIDCERASFVSMTNFTIFTSKWVEEKLMISRITSRRDPKCWLSQLIQNDSGTTSDDSSDEVVCQCGWPNKVEPMIGCDSDDCPVKWYHFECVNLTANTVPKDNIKTFLR
ncbi:hypothetical protein P5673_014624, partial [Acropora cervicornis]